MPAHPNDSHRKRFAFLCNNILAISSLVMDGQLRGNFNRRVSDTFIVHCTLSIVHYLFRSLSKQQFLYFFPLPQGQGSFLPTLAFLTVG